MTEEFHIHIIGSNEGPDRKNSLSPSPYGSAHDIKIYQNLTWIWKETDQEDYQNPIPVLDLQLCESSVSKNIDSLHFSWRSEEAQPWLKKKSSLPDGIGVSSSQGTYVTIWFLLISLQYISFNFQGKEEEAKYIIHLQVPMLMRTLSPKEINPIKVRVYFCVKDNKC